MATYAQIEKWVRETHGWSIQHDGWIAHCKERAGLEPRPAWNRAEDGRAVECPPHRRAGIIAAFRRFGMLGLETED